MTDEKPRDVPPMWRCYKCDDGVWQCHPAGSAGWPDDVSTLCGKKPGPLLERAHAAMSAVVAPYVAKAVAAELRAQAEAIIAEREDWTSYMDCDDMIARLRARADALDPPTGE